MSSEVVSSEIKKKEAKNKKDIAKEDEKKKKDIEKKDITRVLAKGFDGLASRTIKGLKTGLKGSTGFLLLLINNLIILVSELTV